MADNLETKQKKSILSPKVDIVFQILFGEVGSENITKGFLSTILKEKIEEISLEQNIVLRREVPKGKMGVVDVLAKINNNEICNVEMQMTDKKNMIKRMLYYWSRQYSKGIGVNEDYKELKRTIVVLIANFELKELESLGIHSRWKIIEEKEKKIILTEDLEFNINLLTKVNSFSKFFKKMLYKFFCMTNSTLSMSANNYVNIKNYSEYTAFTRA